MSLLGIWNFWKMILNEEEFDYFEGIDALIFYHFKKNPDLMDDEEYIQHYKAIDFQ